MTKAERCEKAVIVLSLAYMACYLPYALILGLRGNLDSQFQHAPASIFVPHFIGMALNFIAIVVTFRDLYLRSFPNPNSKVTWSMLILATGGIGWLVYVFKHALKPRSTTSEINRSNITMPGCVLRLSGPYLELSESIEKAFVPFVMAGHSKRRSPLLHEDITYNHTVSNADNLSTQLTDAEEFIREHLQELVDMRSDRGVERAILDFGWELPENSVFPSLRIPSSLIALCSQSRLEIDVSVYPCDRSK